MAEAGRWKVLASGDEACVIRVDVQANVFRTLIEALEAGNAGDRDVDPFLEGAR